MFFCFKYLKTRDKTLDLEQKQQGQWKQKECQGFKPRIQYVHHVVNAMHEKPTGLNLAQILKNLSPALKTSSV